jgi:hypothetical protein
VCDSSTSGSEREQTAEYGHNVPWNMVIMEKQNMALENFEYGMLHHNQGLHVEFQRPKQNSKKGYKVTTVKWRIILFWAPPQSFNWGPPGQ